MGHMEGEAGGRVHVNWLLSVRYPADIGKEGKGGRGGEGSWL